MNIRIAGEHDLPQIVEIYNQAVAQRGATADLTPITVEARRQWFHDHAPDSWPIWVMADDGAILGWCSLSAYRPGRMALRHTAEISYYIHEAHRRKGIGSSLIRHAIDQCPGLRIKNLFSLLLDVNIPSTRILEKSGFVKWGHMPGVAELDGETCGHLIYGRPVRQPPGSEADKG
ncbi:GNAT family N-acetyltransferase [Elusimicrobiota bacterium]